MPIGNIGTLAGEGGECDADECVDTPCSIACDDGSFEECFRDKCLRVVISGVVPGPCPVTPVEGCAGCTDGNDTFYAYIVMFETSPGSYCSLGFSGWIYCNQPIGAAVSGSIGFDGINLWAGADCGTGFCSGWGIFGIEGEEAIQSAINTLCAGGEVELPFIDSTGSQIGCEGTPAGTYPDGVGDCDYSAATATITLLEGPCPGEEPPDPPENCDAFNGCDPLGMNPQISRFVDCILDLGGGVVRTYTYSNLNDFYFMLCEAASEPTCGGSSGGGTKLFRTPNLGVLGDFDNAGIVIEITEGPGDLREVTAAYDLVIQVDCVDAEIEIVSLLACTHTWTYTEGDPGSLTFSSSGTSSLGATLSTSLKTPAIDCSGAGSGIMRTEFTYANCAGGDDLSFVIAGSIIGFIA